MFNTCNDEAASSEECDYGSKRLAYGPEFITKFVNAIAKFTKRGVHVVRIKS